MTRQNERPVRVVCAGCGHLIRHARRGQTYHNHVCQALATPGTLGSEPTNIGMLETTMQRYDRQRTPLY